ncbi:biosynthetic peptidoglycan transglycosylase [Anaeromyxobacter paludicola]|uniref:Glycosyl transferase family 51 domain-containing protein n=1 Tax=Anaeromyxobacter paludicola TaxID=2918171 RepID=A0ABN6N7I2_9BACT|nr:biosynthetic peptidoglycan transglycosylase [Anaeromyxobacter paludicola]BDG08118.1 hypothetical protein AMPC_12310 [Anaeromyxobacter paludicola]
MPATDPASPQPSPGPAPDAPRRAPGRRHLRAAVALAALAALALAGAVRAGEDRLEREVVARLRARLPDARLGQVGIDWRLRLVIRGLSLPASAPGRPPVLVVDRVAIRPAWARLLAGHPEPASILLDGVALEGGPRGEELARLPERLRSRARAPAERSEGRLPLLRVRQARVRLLLPGEGTGLEQLELGPLDATVRVQGAGAARTAVARASWSGGGLADAEVGLASPRTLRLHVAGVALSQLPAPLARRLPVEPRGGFLSLELRADGLQAEHGQARLSVHVRQALLAGAALGPEPLGPLTAGLQGVVAWASRDRAVLLREGELTLGDAGRARIAVDADLALGTEPRFAVDLSADRLPWDALLAALPPALRPGDEAPRVTGALSGHLALAGPLRRAEAWKLDAALDLSRLSGDPRSFLSRSFRYRPNVQDGPPRELVIGPENPRFVPLAALPPHLVRAVTTSEDAAFWGHHGFDFDELRNAFAEGVDAGRLVRGASTISQQLAKNLFLTPERTLSRKAREALLTVALEASVPKARLLEIYFNVVEWGPGVFGIGEAARHYFDKDPRELTPKEAAFLASIIPNPVRYHMYYARGALTDAWEARVRELLLKLRAVDAIDDAQLQEALDAPLAFARG